MKTLEQLEREENRFYFWTGLGIVTAIVALIAGTIWVFVAMNAWEDACNDAGGQVESRYAGQTTVPVYDSKGNVISYNSQPIYTYHCTVNGQEVEVG